MAGMSIYEVCRVMIWIMFDNVRSMVADGALGVAAGKGWHCDLCRINCSCLTSLQVRLSLPAYLYEPCVKCTLVLCNISTKTMLRRLSEE